MCCSDGIHQIAPVQRVGRRHSCSAVDTSNAVFVATSDAHQPSAVITRARASDYVALRTDADSARCSVVRLLRSI